MGYLLNSQAYQNFVQIEVGIREFLIDLIIEKGANEWFSSFLGNTQRESINEIIKRVNQQLSKGEESSIEELYLYKLRRAKKIIDNNILLDKLHHPFYYLNWTDMESLIRMKSNNELIDEKIGKNNKEIIVSNLSVLNNLRNDIAHSRFINPTDLTIIQGAFGQISATIPNFNSLCERQSMEKKIQVHFNDIHSSILLVEAKGLLEIVEINAVLGVIAQCKNSFWINSLFPELVNDLVTFFIYMNDYKSKRHQPGGLLLIQKWKHQHEMLLSKIKTFTNGKI